MISIVDLTFSYNSSPVLNGVSIQVSAGERWAIIGKNGAGKSTLIRCIAGLETARNGTLKIKNRDLSGYHPRDLAKIISYVPQARERVLPYSVFDYVMMGRFPYQGFMAMPDTADKDVVRAALDLTDCAELSDRLLNQLSGGELQRVLLAGAVSQQTEIMLLDEPTTFLDPLHQALMHKALDRVHREYATTMITVTHDINTALSQSDRILALVKGSAFYAGSTDKFLGRSPGILREIFDIEFVDVELPGTNKRIVMPRTD
jgi:iron complex transport system ATP-binding protein